MLNGQASIREDEDEDEDLLGSRVVAPPPRRRRLLEESEPSFIGIAAFMGYYRETVFGVLL